ncbi:MAG TPA: phosphate/phosphite/phosphonate ABC transporter substrate-binding protein [Bryobacteraceae bacterium]|nr:phosphate/phosphite/phosphonate ABC transporter substrate-binding protein [Bryobacteraceae bacterium]
MTLPSPAIACRCAAFALLLFTAGCARETKASIAGTRAGWPPVLRYNIAVGTENPETQARRTGLVRDYLAGRLGIPVEITTVSNYGATIEAMRAKKVDAASMGPFAYLIASEKAGAEAIATRGTGNDGRAGEYAGTLCVPAASPFHSIDEVIRHAGELTISFVDPASASGFLVERVYLDSRGVDPERDFRKVVFSNNHVFSAMTLVAGKADVAAISENTLVTLHRSGKVAEGAVRVLWKSPPIPNAPIAVGRDLPATLKRQLQDALIEMHDRAPEAFRSMFTATSNLASSSVFVRIDDSAFNGLRAMARGVKNVQLLEK